MTRSQPVHFVTGGAAAGAVAGLIELNGAGRLSALHDPLSYGPLNGYGTPGGVKNRRNWFHRIFVYLKDEEGWEFVEPDIGLPQLAAALEGNAEYVIWCGLQPDDQLLLRAICALLPDHELYMADVAGHWPDEDERCAVGACSPLDLAKVPVTPISVARRAELAAEWRHLVECGGLVRTFDDGAIAVHDGDVFDAALISATHAVFQEANKIVTKVMRQYPLQTSDTYLAHRLHVLVKKGLLHAETGPEPYRIRVRKNEAEACNPLTSY